LAFKKNGVVSRGLSKNKFSPFDLTEIIEFFYTPRFKDREFLQDRYIKKKRTLDEIAAEIGSSRSTVLKYLHENNIPTRERSYAKRSKKAAYGHEIKNYKLVEIKEEQKWIEHMKKLRDSGFSYHKIAEVLNALGVTTKTGKNSWQGKTVYQILEK